MAAHGLEDRDDVPAARPGADRAAVDEHGDAEEPWQELSVDVANESGSETRAVKLLVTYQPQGGGDLKQCRLDTDCGWHERVAAP